MNFKTSIYDFSGMCGDENLYELLSGNEPVRLAGCRDIEGTSCYCSDDAKAEILSRIAASQTDGGRFLNYIDTGDYHYLSYLLSSRIEGPFSLLVLDHHPDMQSPAFGDILSCGGWVRKALEDCPALENVLLIGIDNELAGECEGFPGRVSYVRKDSPQSPGRTMIADALTAVQAMNGRRVYISIDKDVLGRDYARTDWSQGNMSLEELEAILRSVCGISRVVGVDICGGITHEKGGAPDDFRLNRELDAFLHSLLLAV